MSTDDDEFLKQDKAYLNGLRVYVLEMLENYLTRAYNARPTKMSGLGSEASAIGVLASVIETVLMEARGTEAPEVWRAFANIILISRTYTRHVLSQFPAEPAPPTTEPIPVIVVKDVSDDEPS